MDLSIVILAAGQGKRMRSAFPKVLQPLAGQPLLQHVISCSKAVGASDLCVVYGFGGDAVIERMNDPELRRRFAG
jgi:bifunctional UDP-N-acetylglucosamine pyrophosphorylase/glucosamine-1-phosphate N-acetyltransferase